MRRKKNIAIVFLTLLLAGTMPITTLALTTQEKIDQAEQEKKETEGKLSDTKENIDSMKGVQDSLKGQLNNLNEQLTAVGNDLNALEKQIAEQEEQIRLTQAALEEARQTAEAQYELMKTRIRIIYEQGETSYMEMLLTCDNFADILNRAEYISEASRYDRMMLEEYRNTRDEVERQEIALETELDGLNDMKIQVQAKQSQVSGLVSQTANSIAAYADEIDEAEESAREYEAEIAAQEQNLAALRKQLEEEKRLSALAASSAKRDISEVVFADGDRFLLANLIYCEAGGEPYAGQVAVGAVVINRLLSSVYPDTITGVIYQNRQFSPVKSGRLAAALAVNKATESCYRAADEAMAGVTNVGNCVYFRTPIPGLTGISIGGHIFY
ncbi:MAG: cell wall hydrolase [Lachnospiraceae bacterium]|nr:cell wall hydrolase [Lachnospiraceae bacterium]